ncbi:MAG: response regulator [Planctomycetes bacterium]|nr:response regulator [Planctomycetota bacterium]
MADTTNKNIPTIVYVEDNSGDALLLEESLRERGHSVELLIIERGDKALRYFQIKDSARDLPPPHCILLDSHLPIVTGAQLISFIRASSLFDATPVYIFAAEREYREIIGTALVSRQSFITKPNSWQQFLTLADLLMTSVEANLSGDRQPAGSAGPEVPANAELRSLEPEPRP